MDIQVGDLVTYKNSMGNIRQVVIKDEEQKIKYINNVDTYKNILKIERPKYEVVEEKKELLTEDEREFLKQCKKINNSINYIQRFEDKTYLINEDNNKNVFILNDIHKNLFKKLENGYEYTLKELGLEEN